MVKTKKKKEEKIDVEGVFLSALSLYHNVVKYSKKTGTYGRVIFDDVNEAKFIIKNAIEQDEYEHTHIVFLCDLIMPKEYAEIIEKIKNKTSDFKGRLQLSQECMSLSSFLTSIELINEDIDDLDLSIKGYKKIEDKYLDRLSEDAFMLLEYLKKQVFLDRFISTTVFFLICNIFSGD